MNRRPDSDPGVLQELRRRRVFRVSAAYLAVALGAICVGDVLIHLSLAPDWLFRGLLGTAALGFPFTVVLAWTYDITPEGIVRTPDESPDAPPGEGLPAWAWPVTVGTGLLTAAVSSLVHLLAG